MNRSDLKRNAYMLCGHLAKRGYLRWWHSFSGTNRETGAMRTFYVEYLILNPTPAKPKIGSLPVPSYVRISAGCFPSNNEAGVQLNVCYPISEARFAASPLYFQIFDCALSENRLSGAVSVSEEEASIDCFPTDAGTISWNLEILKSISCRTGLTASPLFCALNAMDSFWHAEGIRSEYRGTVILNGQAYDISPAESFGYADKHWGRSYNRLWLQLSSCCLYSQKTGKYLKHSALAVDGCCPRFLFFRLRPRLSLQLTYTGEDYCYSFAGPHFFSKVKWCTKENRERFVWQIGARNSDSLIKLSINCPKRRMLTLHYEEPGISARESLPAANRVRTGGEGLGTIELYRLTPAGKELVDTLTVRNAFCAFQKPRTVK